MKDIEPTNLCETCQKQLDCFKKGIFKRGTCDEYEPRQIGNLLEQDKFVCGVMVSACPRCGSENTYSCENNPLLEDITVGHCLDCETYWCLECGYIFKVVEKKVACPHQNICDRCSKEHGYLGLDTFIEEICPTCDLYDNGCQLEKPLECEKQWRYRCPYDRDVSECPKIEEFLKEQM